MGRALAALLVAPAVAGAQEETVEAVPIEAVVEVDAPAPEPLGHDDWSDLFRHEARGVKIVDGRCPKIGDRGASTLSPGRAGSERTGIGAGMPSSDRDVAPAPAIVVDGVRISDDCFPVWLDPATVVAVKVERASGASAAYGGTRAAGGVIRITTEEGARRE